MTHPTFEAGRRAFESGDGMPCTEHASRHTSMLRIMPSREREYTPLQFSFPNLVQSLGFKREGKVNEPNSAQDKIR